jgi:hypothetical protein
MKAAFVCYIKIFLATSHPDVHSTVLGIPKNSFTHSL